MSAKSSAVPARRAPLLSLWSREDPRTAVIDFLPTKTIAALPFVAKALRDAQSRLLLTAIKRRGKVAVPSPPTTRACLDALLVGEPQYFCKNWGKGNPQGCLVCDEEAPIAQSYVGQSPYFGKFGYFLELSGQSYGHRGYAVSLRAQNLLVRRLSVTMSYLELVENDVIPEDPGGAVGYVMLCGPDAPTHPYAGHSAIDDFMGGLRFSKNLGENAQVSLKWLQYNPENNQDHVLVEGTEPNTTYLVDATFNHESVTSCLGTVDISVNGQTVAEGIPVIYNPLSSIQMYNWSRGTSQIGEIDVWYEKATPNQAWKFDLDDYR